MKQTPRGYPYPETTDQPNGPYQVQQLAETVDEDVDDLARSVAAHDQSISTLTTRVARQVQVGTRGALFGTVPANGTPRLFASSYVGTTDSSGKLLVAHGQSFSCVTGIVLSSGDRTNATHIARSPTFINGEGFDVIAYNGASVVATRPVRVDYLVVGY